MSKQAWPDKRFCLEEVNLCRVGRAAVSPTRIREKLVVGLAARADPRLACLPRARPKDSRPPCRRAIFLQAAVWGSERVGDVEVSVQPLPSHENSAGGPYYPVNGNIHGYVEFRVQLKNFRPRKQRRASALSRRRTLRAHRSRRGRFTNGCIAGGQEVSVSLYQPPVEAARRFDGSAGGGSAGWWLGFGSGPVLIARGSAPHTIPQSSIAGRVAQPERSARLPRSWVDKRRRQSRERRRARSHLIRPPPEPLRVLRSELPVSQWSGNWLGYSCYDVILVTQKEVEQMPAQVQSAIRRYIECGGTLLVHGQQVPVAFSQGAVRNGGEGEYLERLRSRGGKPRCQCDGLGQATYKCSPACRSTSYQPMQKPADRLNLSGERGDGAGAGIVRLGIVVWRRHRPDQRLAAFQIQAADLALVERAHDFVADLSRHIFGYASFSEGLERPRKSRQFHVSRRGFSSRHDDRLSVVLLPAYALGGATFRRGYRRCPAGQPIETGDFTAETKTTCRCTVDWTNDQYFGSGWVKPACRPTSKSARTKIAASV